MEKITLKENIYQFDNFLSDEECNKIVDFFKTLDTWEITCFYNAFIGKHESNVSWYNEFCENMKEKLLNAAEYAFDRKLKRLSFGSHKWSKGSSAGFHSDNSEMDGTPNAWQDNKLVTIVYLNDDYDGGELLFRDHNISIKPKRGTMIAFTSGFDNIHGVSEVKNSDRYTFLASYDWIDSVYQEDLKALREASAPKQQEQRDQWYKN